MRINLKNISDIEELSIDEQKIINGGEYDVLNWLVDKIGFGVGYVGEKINQGVGSFLKHAPQGSHVYLN